MGLLTACVTFLSAFVKNVGTLGIFIPVATHVAERWKRSTSIYLMPLAFGSLIGGTIIQIGTSPNLLISSIRQDLTGTPFEMFDFTAVSLPLACGAVVFLAVAWRLIPKSSGSVLARAPLEIAHYVSELRVRANSPLLGRTIAELEALSEGELAVTALVRDGGHGQIPTADWTLREADILAVRGERR